MRQVAGTKGCCMHGIIETIPSEVKRRLAHWLHRVICLIVFLNLISYGQNGRDIDPGLFSGLALERVQRTEQVTL